MIKKTVTYTDFNGDEVSEDLFFHLSQAELVEMEMSEKEGLSAALKKIVDAEDGKAIIREFKTIILSAYGQRSEDGKRFVKTQQLRDEFESSEAYSALFMELVTDTDAAVEFTNGIVPVKVVEEATRRIEEASRTDHLQVVPEPRKVTKAEMQAMTPEDLRNFTTAISNGEAVLVDDNPIAD